MSQSAAEHPEFAKATLLALSTIASDDAKAQPPVAFIFPPSNLRLGSDGAAEALRGMAKPLSCGGTILESALKIDCRTFHTLAEVTEHENTAAFWIQALTRSIARILGPDSGARKAMLRGRGTAVLVTVDDVPKWLQQYNFRDKLGFDVTEPDPDARNAGADVVISFAGPGVISQFRMSSDPIR
jgi:uncharacterized protein YegJ (DUF2314 family)